MFKNTTFEGYRICYKIVDDKIIKRKHQGQTYNMIKLNLLGYVPVELLMLLKDVIKIDKRNTQYVDADEVENELNSEGIYKSRED